ncbi:MAG: NAD-binding protein [Chloroflexi bacterium]|nr:NAD-binding protein [Chloroflexota bacterium]
MVWQRAWTSTPPTAQTQGEIDSRRNRPAQLFEARFALKTTHKDLRLGEELAEACEVQMPLAQVCRDLYSQAMSRGWDEYDSSIVLTLQGERAGVQVRLERSET